VVILDAAGRIGFWDEGARAIVGYDADEVVGLDLEPLVPERLWGRHRDGLEAGIARGTPRHAGQLLALPARHRDGRTLSIEFRVVLLGGDPPTAVGAVIRDATERFERERRASGAVPGDPETRR
jgi:PAS domain S-box-containing protein